MQDTFLFEVVSPEGIMFEGSVAEVILPTSIGQIAILPHHTPLSTKLVEGMLTIKTGKEEFVLGITGGFLQIAHDKASVLADYAVRAESIEATRAEEAKKRAQATLEEKREKVDFFMAEKELKKSLLELKIAEKIRRKTPQT